MDFQSSKIFLISLKFTLLTRSYLWHAGSLDVALELSVAACGIWFWPGLNLDLLHWEYSVFTTGPPGKSQMNGS